MSAMAPRIAVALPRISQVVVPARILSSGSFLITSPCVMDGGALAGARSGASPMCRARNAWPVVVTGADPQGGHPRLPRHPTCSAVCAEGSLSDLRDLQPAISGSGLPLEHGGGLAAERQARAQLGQGGA